MDQQLKEALSQILGVAVSAGIPVSGGDISSAFLLETATGRVFCKLNSQPGDLSLFEAEKQGLEALARAACLRCPEVLLCGAVEGYAVMLLEYVPSKRPAPIDMARLGHGLAALHQTTAPHFGWEQDNFIGSLPQGNSPDDDWSRFYLQQRLLPQLRRAVDSGFLDVRDVPGETRMQSVLEDTLGPVEPALLHGDLWNGNFLISETGVPYLIDPAVYYGHHEADLAMTRLFGGFSDPFYAAYHEILPPATGYEERQDIYQAYYLLVHLNLFGHSYYPAVLRILSRYFGK